MGHTRTHTHRGRWWMHACKHGNIGRHKKTNHTRTYTQHTHMEWWMWWDEAIRNLLHSHCHEVMSGGAEARKRKTNSRPPLMHLHVNMQPLCRLRQTLRGQSSQGHKAHPLSDLWCRCSPLGEGLQSLCRRFCFSHTPRRRWFSPWWFYWRGGISNSFLFFLPKVAISGLCLL